MALVEQACAFRFGAAWQGEGGHYDGVDYLTVWIGQESEGAGSAGHACAPSPCFNPWWHGAMLREAARRDIGAAYYAYVIAFLARQRAGLADCDTVAPGERSLCTHGAAFIRASRGLILETYAHFANATAEAVGREAEVLWLVEPDFYQYSVFALDQRSHRPAQASS